MELKGYTSVDSHLEEGVVKFLGYCPQENVLWPMLTVKEHLELYAAVKGLRKADAALAISRYSAFVCLLCTKKQGSVPL